VSVQSRFLQYAAAKQWGDKEFNRLDKYTIAVPHPDATAALIAGGTELTGHFSNPPFQDQALANPNVHVVLNSYDLLGPNSPTVLFATEKFRNDNPKTYKAFVEAWPKPRAIRPERQRRRGRHLHPRDQGQDRPRRAAENHRQPAVRIQRHAEKHLPLAEFLYRVGAIKNKPESWKDYFFQDAKPLQGS
jgi:NitT/TauT family transport system substrate-binding protein